MGARQPAKRPTSLRVSAAARALLEDLVIRLAMRRQKRVNLTQILEEAIKEKASREL